MDLSRITDDWKKELSYDFSKGKKPPMDGKTTDASPYYPVIDCRRARSIIKDNLQDGFP